MDKDLRGKKLGVGISQREDGWYITKHKNHENPVKSWLFKEEYGKMKLGIVI